MGSAKLPVNIGWVIKRTPDVDSVPIHLYALVLGTDIWAPIGLELWVGVRTDGPILAYAADVSRNTGRPSFPPGERVPTGGVMRTCWWGSLAGYLPFLAALPMATVSRWWNQRRFVALWRSLSNPQLLYPSERPRVAA